MAYKSITINAGDSAYLPKNIVLIGTSSTGDAQIISSCLPPPTSGLQCYSLYFPLNDEGGPDYIMDNVKIEYLSAGGVQYPIQLDIGANSEGAMMTAFAANVPKAIFDVLSVVKAVNVDSRKEFRITFRSFPEIAENMYMYLTAFTFAEGLYLHPKSIACPDPQT